MKKCTKCRKELGLKDFGKDKYRKDGLCSWCKICHKENSERYRSANPEKYKESQKKSRIKNREKINVTRRKYYKDNFPKILQWQSEYRKKNLEKARSWGKKYDMTHKMIRSIYNQKWKFLKRYGLFIEDYQKILEHQEGKCAICKRERALQVDHDHKTQRIRGLLCYQCNSAIGFLQEDIKIMNNAIKYLKKYKNLDSEKQ